MIWACVVTVGDPPPPTTPCGANAACGLDCPRKRSVVEIDRKKTHTPTAKAFFSLYGIYTEYRTIYID